MIEVDGLNIHSLSPLFPSQKQLKNQLTRDETIRENLLDSLLKKYVNY